MSLRWAKWLVFSFSLTLFVTMFSSVHISKHPICLDFWWHQWYRNYLTCKFKLMKYMYYKIEWFYLIDNFVNILKETRHFLTKWISNNLIKYINPGVLIIPRIKGSPKILMILNINIILKWTPINYKCKFVPRWTRNGIYENHVITKPPMKQWNDISQCIFQTLMNTNYTQCTLDPCLHVIK